MPDILIGAIDGYNWDQIKPWVLSAKQSGFSGEMWLITYRIDSTTVTEIGKHGVNIYPVGDVGMTRPGVPSISHNLRMYHAWQLLHRLGDRNYRFAIMTDVRDVIFQKNPSDWLERVFVPEAAFHYIAPSEGILFKDEEWNRNNVISGFGQLYDLLNFGDSVAANVGTIAGRSYRMSRLFLQIYEMTHREYYPSDQSAFNILANYLHDFEAKRTNMHEGWAAQLGTTHDPTKAWLWDRLCEPRPLIDPDGNVTTTSGELFTLVHQWDRQPELKQIITQRYQ